MHMVKLIAYASRNSKSHEKNYPTRDLKLEAVVFVLNLWIYYLYELYCEFFSDHVTL